MKEENYFYGYDRPFLLHYPIQSPPCKSGLNFAQFLQQDNEGEAHPSRIATNHWLKLGFNPSLQNTDRNQVLPFLLLFYKKV